MVGLVMVGLAMVDLVMVDGTLMVEYIITMVVDLQIMEEDLINHQAL